MDKKEKRNQAAAASNVPDTYLQGLYAGYELAMSNIKEKQEYINQYTHPDKGRNERRPDKKPA